MKQVCKNLYVGDQKDYEDKKTIEWRLSDKGSAWLDECMKQNQEWLKKNYDNRK